MHAVNLLRLIVGAALIRVLNYSILSEILTYLRLFAKMNARANWRNVGGYPIRVCHTSCPIISSEYDGLRLLECNLWQ